MISYELLIAIIFYTLLGIILFINRKKFEILDKVFLVYKSKKPIKLMIYLSRFRIFWKIFSTLAIPVSVFFMFWGMELLIDNSFKIMLGVSGAGAAPVIPGVRIPGSPIFVPLLEGIVALIVMAIIHEFSHGIVASMEGIKLKSAGFGFFFVLPLAFVEPDEKQMNNVSALARMRVAASGPFANLTLYFLLMLILSWVFSPLISMLNIPNGISILGVEGNSPASDKGIIGNELITQINGKNISTIEEFSEEMKSIHPGDSVLILASGKIFNLTAASYPSNSSKGYLGINLKQSYISKVPIISPILIWMGNLLWWVALLNFLIGIVNFLPLWLVDGGKIVYDLISYIITNKKIQDAIAYLILTGSSLIFLFNLIGPFIMKSLLILMTFL